MDRKLFKFYVGLRMNSGWTLKTVQTKYAINGKMHSFVNLSTNRFSCGNRITQLNRE